MKLLQNQSRKEFIRNVSLFAGGAMLTNGLFSSFKKVHGSEMKLGLVTYLWAKDWDIPNVMEMNIGSYPYQQLMDLFVKMDYKGWILLECLTDPADKVAALKEQNLVWREMIVNAQKKL